MAALLVAVFHVWFGRVSGGVDVFFVVSGYLITTSLSRQLDENGRLSWVAFWARLGKRLLPAALTVLSAVLVSSMLWLPQDRWGPTLRELVASTLYLENWSLAFSATDYLDRESASSPVQHYWALSVQGQFYLTWPFLVSAAAFCASRYRFTVRATLLATMVCVFVASLTYSIYATHHNQAFAYFDTLARMWEFSMGGVLALVLPKLAVPARVGFVLGWVGLLAILSCGIVLQVSTVFPGYAALWPTLGAVLVLVAGKSRFRLSAFRLLSSKPLAYLGDISYSLYLWHWPILVFYRLFSDQAEFGLVEGGLLLAFSALLAAATTRWIEDPVRRSAIGAKRSVHALAFGFLGTTPLLVGATAWAVHIQAADQREQGTVLGSDQYPGAAAMDQRVVFEQTAAVPVRPSPLRAKKDLPAVYADGCQQKQRLPEVLSCVYGVKDSKTTVALVGASHATQWLPALEILAQKYRWRIVTFTKSSCLFAAKSNASTKLSERQASCEAWNESVLARLVQLEPDLVVATATRGSGTKEHVPSRFLDQWAKLEEVGIQIVAIRDNPWMGFDVSECVEREGPTSSHCMRPRAQMLAKTSPLSGLENPPSNVHFVDLSDFFCDANTCPAVIGNVLVYRDKHHITATYVRTLTPYLEEQMLSAEAVSSLAGAESKAAIR